MCLLVLCFKKNNMVLLNGVYVRGILRFVEQNNASKMTKAAKLVSESV